MNKPVAYIDHISGKPKLIDAYVVQTDYDIPLYTHQYERPHNTVLVPCDKLAEMQNEIKTLKAELSKYPRQGQSIPCGYTEGIA